jgi:hypothetical protein
VVRPQLPPDNSSRRRPAPANHHNAQGAASAAAGAARAAAGEEATTGRPYLLYIPDIDGIGATSKQQWGELNAAFDFYMLKLLPADRSSFAQITAVAVVSLRGRWGAREARQGAWRRAADWCGVGCSFPPPPPP